MSTFEASKNQFNQYHFSVVEIDLPIVEGVVDISTSIKDAAPEWYWRLDEIAGNVAVDEMLNGNLEYESIANTSGYSIAPSNTDGVGSAKAILGDSALQIYDPVDIPVAAVNAFSVDLWTGNGTTQTIVNSLDFAGGDGLVWIKGRTGSKSHALFDVSRGATKYLRSDFTELEVTDASSLTAFNANGYSLGNSLEVNQSGDTFVGWSFLKEVSFFDVVKYVGDGVSTRDITHSLGIAPGMVMIKNTDSNSIPWRVQHRSTSPTKLYNLSVDGGAQVDGSFRDTLADATSIKVTGDTDVNAVGVNYVAYVFGHDVSAGGAIQCGSYVGNGSTTGPTINLGWDPDFILIKRQDSNGLWAMHDTTRGLAAGADALMYADLSANESSTTDRVDLTGSGFQIKTDHAIWNSVGDTYVYMAIRVI